MNDKTHESLTIIYSRDGTETGRIEIPEAHNIQFQTQARYLGDVFALPFGRSNSNLLTPIQKFDFMLTTEAYPVGDRMYTVYTPVKPKPTRRAKSRKHNVKR